MRVMVNGEDFRDMIIGFLRRKLEDIDEVWFQQDGAIRPTFTRSFNLLRTIFLQPCN